MHMKRRRDLLFEMSGSGFSIVLVVLILLCVSNCQEEKGDHIEYWCQQQKGSPASYCGKIQNISYPFRLKTDPPDPWCRLPTYELECDSSNRTVLRLNRTGSYYDHYDYYYYVEAINYVNSTIRIVDPGLQKHNCSSRPLHSLPLDEIEDDSHSYDDSPALQLTGDNTPVVIIDCAAPMISKRYLNTATTATGACADHQFQIQNPSRSNSSTNLYSYVAIAYDLTVSDLEATCSVSTVAWASSHIINHHYKTSSFSDIHYGLVYGFEVSWNGLYCSNCHANMGICSRTSADTSSFECRSYTLPASQRTLPASQRFPRFLLRNYPTICKDIGIYLTARFVCGILFLFALVAYKQRKMHLSMYDTIEDFLQTQNNLMPTRHSYLEIMLITRNFKDKLGEGGFGTVYKGKLKNGLVVAVKMMGKSKATGQDFINEVGTIGRIHHVNVVQLIGFCSQGSKRALVYEFMPNGSLEKYIFSRNQEVTSSLSCEKMFEISLKVARGIEYLHRGCDMQILHFDIKPHNILLDHNFNPKISDFGLAKLHATEDSIVTMTAARGTLGYMAPELFYKNIGGVSCKADVYSFGMLLMEMAGRRKNWNALVDQPSQIYFPSWIYDQFIEGKDVEIGDAATEDERKKMKKMVIVALWCIQMKPSDRPLMNKVVEMLEGDVELLQMPPKPFLCRQEMPTEDRGVSKTPTQLSLSSDDLIIEGR